jgi:hypothetical protein
VKRSLREVLAHSHVAAVAIAVLLFCSLDGTFRALWPLISDVVKFVVTAIAILDVPYISFPSLDTTPLIRSGWYLYVAVVGGSQLGFYRGSL